MANVTGTAIGSRDGVGCGSYFSGKNYITGAAIRAYDQIGCSFTLGINPDGLAEPTDTDLVYLVWTNKGQSLTLDNATVEWVASDSEGNPLITKSTDDYSIITFDSTLVVHLSADELIPNEPLFYTATITTSDDSTYEMTGWLSVVGSVIDTCFMQDVTIISRPITLIPVIQRTATTLALTQRTASAVAAEQRIPVLIPITERTPEDIIVLPCGKRGHT